MTTRLVHSLQDKSPKIPNYPMIPVSVGCHENGVEIQIPGLNDSDAPVWLERWEGRWRLCVTDSNQQRHELDLGAAETDPTLPHFD